MRVYFLLWLACVIGEDVTIRYGDLEIREETDALLQIVERIGTIKRGVALFRTTSELSTALTSNLSFASVVGHNGTQYFTRVLAQLKNEMRISIAAVDATLRIIVHDKDRFRPHLAAFGKLLPPLIGLEYGFLCDNPSDNPIHDEIRRAAQAVISFLNMKLDIFQQSTNQSTLHKDVVRILEGLRRPAEALVKHFADEAGSAADEAE